MSAPAWRVVFCSPEPSPDWWAGVAEISSEVRAENAIVLARELRQEKPQIVLAPQLDENQHPDHSAAGPRRAVHDPLDSRGRVVVVPDQNRAALAAAH